MVENPQGGCLVRCHLPTSRWGAADNPKSEALAIVASPCHLHPKEGKEVVVNMGLVFISPHIEVASFASTHIALKDWMEQEGLLQGTRILFVQLGPLSRL